MKRTLATSLVVLAALTSAAPRWNPQTKKGPGHARVSLYRVAPGQQLAFLNWLAAREEVAKEAGIPAGQLYAHLDGDSWDYLLIAPVTSSEQDGKFDAIAARKSVKTGFAASLQFRDFLTFHTDTLVSGPITAADLVAEAAK
ncbi:MAG TPA: hypothetical protein VMT87_10545 [Vicinamibacteria bacterium]|nr:hypothetical protein [Vicinamibacteria bacterium]